ncbi:MAG: ComF family protein [Bacteroidales bacterium]|nr:ComF family protein [Bacteroidales bacterium]
MNKIKLLLKNFISIFYPRSCVACGNALLQNESHFCLSCLMHLPETNYHLMEHSSSDYIFEGRVPVEKVASMLFYKKGNNVQHILHALKYKGNKEVGRFLGELYGQQLLKSPYYQSVDCIVPIPLHPKKLRMRGYNQSEWIAMGLARSMNIPYYTDVLYRSEFTETQTKKSRFNRWENVKGVFVTADTEKIIGKHVLICDDVLTTGATMEAAITQLLKIEGVRVSVATLACAN